MKCIFICLFLEELDKLYVLLESIFIYGNLEDTHIVIYTTPDFMENIKKSHLFCDSIVFAVKDQATNARLDYFDLDLNYEKVLHLNTNCVVKGDLSQVFDLACEDVMYVLEENGLHYSTSRFGGKNVFESNIWLFRSCDTIRELFAEMKGFTKPNGPGPGTGTAKIIGNVNYVVCNATSRHLFHDTLTQVAVSDENIYSDKVIHCCKDPHSFLNRRKEATIHVCIQEAKFYILKHLLPLIHNSGELLEGNIFMTHHTTEFSDVFLDKQRNISNLVLNTGVRQVMEIGFNSGFSALLMLLSNPHMKLTCFDLGEHAYTRPCFEKLKEHFGNRIQLILGDSCQTLPHANGVFDLIHIDGGHSTEVAESDIVQSYRLSKPGTILIMDDYDFGNLHELWDRSIQTYKLKPLNIRVYPCIYHDIKFV